LCRPTSQLFGAINGTRQARPSAVQIAQMVLGRYEVLPIERGTVSVSTDRIGGFGSTGR